VSSAASKCRKVLFPAPEGPTTAISFPVATLTVTPESTLISVAPAPYFLHKSRVSISAPDRAAAFAAVLVEVVIPVCIFGQNFVADH
jgi:hypothetical protein